MAFDPEFLEVTRLLGEPAETTAEFHKTWRQFKFDVQHSHVHSSKIMYCFCNMTDAMLRTSKNDRQEFVSELRQNIYRG